MISVRVIRYLAAIICFLLLSACFSACVKENNGQTADLQTEQPESSENGEVSVDNTEAAFTEAPTQAPEKTEHPEGPLHSPARLTGDELTRNLKEIRSRIENIRSETVDESSIRRLDWIPVYYEEDVIKAEWRDAFGLGFDSGYWLDSEMLSGGEEFLLAFPETVYRKLPDGRAFFIVDTDTGFRVFVQLGPSRYYCKGHAIVIKDCGESHWYKQFRNLKNGDSIDSVIAIDPSAELYKRLAEDYRPGTVHRSNLGNDPFTSIHYLADGILLIEYDADENDNLFVDRIIYSKDYLLPDYRGNMVNYKLCELDIP